MFNAILWILKTRASWRDLPKEFGPWQTAYKRFVKCAKMAVWDGSLLELSKDADPGAILIDAFYVKLHQHGPGAKGGILNS